MIRLTSWAVLLLISVAWTGCRSNPPAGDLSRLTFQLDWYPQPEQGGFYEALLKGYYAQEGLDIVIQPGGPYSVAEQQVSTNEAQFGMSSSDRLLEADSQGQSLVAIGAAMQHDPQGLMLHASSPVQSFADLEGRTVALKPGSTWFEYLVARYKLKNVRQIPATYSFANFLQDPSYIQQIFVTSEPYFARKAGAQVRTLLISDTGYDPYRIFFTRRDFLADHPDIVAKFVRASLRGWRDYIADPSAVDAELLKLNPALTMDQVQFTAGALRDRHFIYPDGEPSQAGTFDPARWAAMYRQLSDLGLIKHPFDPATAYTTHFAGQTTSRSSPSP